MFAEALYLTASVSGVEVRDMPLSFPFFIVLPG